VLHTQAADDTTLMQFWVTRVAGDTVSGEVFGSSRSFPLSEAIPVKAVRAERLAAERDFVVTQVTESLWDWGMLLGYDGDFTHVREPGGIQRYAKKKVFRVPDAYLAAYANARRSAASQRASLLNARPMHRGHEK
jgi:hypothetical protein